MRPFFQEVHRQVFGPNTTVFIVFSAPQGPLPFLDDLSMCTGYTSFNLTEPTPTQRPVERLYPVLLVEPELVVYDNIPAESVPRYLRETTFAKIPATCHLGYVEKFRACALYDQYFGHKPNEPHFSKVETTTGTDNLHSLRAGEHLRAVTFGLASAYV